MTPEEKQKLAAEVRAWRGKVTAKEAAKRLGISKRTYEGVEQGRGIAHPFLLVTTIQHIKAGDQNDGA